MLKHTFEYLIANPAVLHQVREGKACLIGLSEIEIAALMKTFDEPIIETEVMDYWK